MYYVTGKMFRWPSTDLPHLMFEEHIVQTQTDQTGRTYCTDTNRSDRQNILYRHKQIRQAEHIVRTQTDQTGRTYCADTNRSDRQNIKPHFVTDESRYICTNKESSLKI